MSCLLRGQYWRRSPVAVVLDMHFHLKIKARSEAKHKLLEIKWQFYDAQRSQRKQRPSANNSYPEKCIVKFSPIKAYVPGNIKLRMRDADKDAGFMAHGGGWAVKTFQPTPEHSAFNAFSNCIRCAYKTRLSNSFISHIPSCDPRLNSQKTTREEFKK